MFRAGLHTTKRVGLENRQFCCSCHRSKPTTFTILSTRDATRNAYDSQEKNALDPFAYRRAGISAARLNQWVTAGRIYLEGANSIKDNTLKTTKFGLAVDAALGFARGGKLTTAATILADAVLGLPPEASEDGHQQWDMVQRLAVKVSIIINNSTWKQGKIDHQLASGFASSPDLKNTEIEPNQVLRHQMTKAEALFLAIILTNNPDKYALAIEELAESQHPIIQQKAIEGKLAFSISAGAGKGFIPILLEFDRIISETLHRIKLGIPLTENKNEPLSGVQQTPHRWFGFLCAAAVTAGSEIFPKLQIWLIESTDLLGESSELMDMIKLLIEGVSIPKTELWSAVADSNLPGPIRCGAAIKLLQEELPIERTFQLQCFLTSAMLSDDSLTRQQLFNRSIAKCFAETWKMKMTQPFQLYSPRTSVPSLQLAIDGLDDGDSTLQSILVAASRVAGQPQEKFMDHLL